MKKILTLTVSLLFLTNIAFAAYSKYDYDDLNEKKSHKKLYYGLALTLVGGFLMIDGFSKVEEDISKPSVDYTSVLHYEWHQENGTYTFRSGTGDPYYIDGQSYSIIPNAVYNNGNVDLYNVTLEVRYYINDPGSGYQIYTPLPNDEDTWKSHSLVGGKYTPDDYHTVSVRNVSLDKNKFFEWTDVWQYTAEDKNKPKGNGRSDVEITSGDKELVQQGVYLGENALEKKDSGNDSGAIEIRVNLKPHENYKPIYTKKNKSDLEGVAGILLVTAGIYFLLDYAFGFTEFKRYMKNNDMGFRLASRPSEYKLLLEKRI